MLLLRASSSTPRNLTATERRPSAGVVSWVRPTGLPYAMCGSVVDVVKTTVYLPPELHRDLKQAAKERGTSEAELIRTAVRHELLGAPAGQVERARRRARLLAAMGTLDTSVYPSGYLDELRAGWRD